MIRKSFFSNGPGKHYCGLFVVRGDVDVRKLLRFNSTKSQVNKLLFMVMKYCYCSFNIQYF